jgi:hypothetical protein
VVENLRSLGQTCGSLPSRGCRFSTCTSTTPGLDSPQVKNLRPLRTVKKRRRGRLTVLGLGRRINPNAPPVLYWLRLERDGSGGARYAAEKIDDDSGVGTQVAVANKRGMFAFTQK